LSLLPGWPNSWHRHSRSEMETDGHFSEVREEWTNEHLDWFRRLVNRDGHTILADVASDGNGDRQIARPRIWRDLHVDLHNA